MKLRPISLSWLTLVLAIALLLIIVGAATYWSYTDSVRRYERQSNSLFEQAESIIELTLQQHAQALGQSLETIVDKMYTALPTDNRRDSAHLTQLLTEQYTLHSAYSLDVLAYADQSSGTPLIDVSLEHFTFGQLLQTFEEQPFRFAQPTILSFRTEPSSEPLTLMLLEKAVVDPVSGRSMGTLYGGIVLSHHGRILAEIGQKAQLARVELIDETGQLLASSQRGTPENTALRLCPDTTQNAPSSHITRCYPLIGSASIRILLETPPDLFASLRQDVHHRLTWIVLLSALLIVAGAAIYQQLISRALRTFIRYTRRLAVRREHTPFVPTMIAEFNLAGEALERMHSEQKAYEDRIRYQATHDPLTGLPNRTRFMEQLRSALKNTQSKKLAVLFIDLDRFKVINDTLGHHIGDEVLIGVSKRFRRVPILCDTVSRFGGDEFVAYIENIDTQENGGHIAQAILDTFQAPFHAGGQDLFLRCSIGLSLYPDDARNAEGLLRHADSAMYRAKAFGRNNYQFYTAAMSFQAQERLSLESDLHCALDNHEFLLYYQPKIELESGAITGMEALLRWKHPQHGIMSPDNFIPILEEVGLIVPVGEWVLWEAAKACAKWQQQAGRPLQVAVNLSYRQLQQRNFANTVATVLRETGLEPAMLELEITESMVMEDLELVISTLQGLHQLGVSIAIDDFGTGYTSLSHIKRLPLSTLKIDKSFVMNLDDDSNNATIISAVIGLSRNFGLAVVAEGVERPSHIEWLKNAGCQIAQGYHFSRPLPEEAFVQYLQEKLNSSARNN